MSSYFPSYSYWNSVGVTRPERKTRDEFMFGSEPIEAWRAWNVGSPSYDSLSDFLGLLADAHDAGAENPYRWAQQQTRQTLLMSLATGSEAWLPGNAEAKCVTGLHKAPDLQCECGYWALRDEEKMREVAGAYQGWVAAWGKVKLWRRYCEFEHGYRAQYAAPVEITLCREDPSLADELARTYGCDVRVGKAPQPVPPSYSLGGQASYAQMLQQINQYWLSSPPTLAATASAYPLATQKKKHWWLKP